MESKPKSDQFYKWISNVFTINLRTIGRNWKSSGNLIPCNLLKSTKWIIHRHQVIYHLSSDQPFFHLHPPFLFTLRDFHAFMWTLNGVAVYGSSIQEKDEKVLLQSSTLKLIYFLPSSPRKSPLQSICTQCSVEAAQETRKVKWVEMRTRKEVIIKVKSNRTWNVCDEVSAALEILQLRKF